MRDSQRIVDERSRWRATLLAAMALGLGACSPGIADLQQQVAEIKTRKGPPLEPLPVVQTFETFEYTAQNLRDPFAAPVVQETVGDDGPRPDMNRPREALESYPLDSLDMVGTLGLGSDVAALVKDPEGVIHRIRIENYLGQNFGRVTSIFEDRIELVELISNGVGGWIERPASIALENQ
jgi:type IV pilus assembly protein PilP